MKNLIKLKKKEKKKKKKRKRKKKKRKKERKKEDIFHVYLQNIDCGYQLESPRPNGSNEYPQFMFWSKNKKNRYIPVYPSFTIKMRFKGVYISRTCFPDVIKYGPRSLLDEKPVFGSPAKSDTKRPLQSQKRANSNFGP